MLFCAGILKIIGPDVVVFSKSMSSKYFHVRSNLGFIGFDFFFFWGGGGGGTNSSC